MHEVQRPPFRPGRYLAPASIADALAALDELGSSARVIAGGTDLMVELDRRIGPDCEVLVDISRIAGLDTIELRDGRIHLGPSVTHNQAATSELVRQHGLALAQASAEVGSPALRNRATVAGNVVTASPANDTISALRALGAKVDLTSLAGTRSVPLGEFHVGVRKTLLSNGELLTGISFPAHTAATSIFVKAGLRRAQAISVVHIAIACEIDPSSGVTSAVRIALGSVAPTIVRASESEQFLEGRQLTDETVAEAAKLAAASVAPIDDLRATADYRRDLVEIMVRRALTALSGGQERSALLADPPTLGGPNIAPNGSAVHMAPGDLVTSTINGVEVQAPWRPTSLLTWLREEAALTGTKEGCAEGECGACTVHLDGVATLSCLVPAGRAQDAAITTIEGLAQSHDLHPLQQAFIDCAAVQCGYCIPGFLMAGAALQAERSELDRGDLAVGLSGNLCRCTGYYSIESAFAAQMDGEK